MKKIDIYEIKGFDPIDISFEKKESMFYADFLGQKFNSNDINALKSQLFDAAEGRKTVSWKHVILIRSGRWYLEKKHSGIEIKKQFLGTIVEEGKEPKFVLADVHTDFNTDSLDVANWKPAVNYTIWSGDGTENRLIPYTRERWNALIYIEETMGLMRQNLFTIMNGKDADLWLDRLVTNNTLLLSCASIAENKVDVAHEP